MVKKIKDQQILVSAANLDAMADNIAAISRAGEILKTQNLKERAILLLLRDMTGLPLDSIKAVLDALPELQKRYCK